MRQNLQDKNTASSDPKESHFHPPERNDSVWRLHLAGGNHQKPVFLQRGPAPLPVNLSPDQSEGTSLPPSCYGALGAPPITHQTC